MSLLSSTRYSRLTLVLCASALLCSPAGVVHAQAAKPFEELSNSARGIRDSLVQMARAQIGKRYRTGGVSPEKGFDCSGLVQYVLAGLNLRVPRTSRQQAAVGRPRTSDTSRLLPGDPERARRFATRIRAGQVHINYPAWDPRAPFGGYKRSGNGREYGVHGFEEYLETKAILGYHAQR